MKADTKIALTTVIWLPAFVLGVVVGLLFYGFMGGFGVYQLLDGWFDESNKRPDEI